MNLNDFVNHPVIQQKYKEFGYGAEYMVAYGKHLKDNHHRAHECFDISNIRSWTRANLDIFRSVLDRNSTLMPLDVEMYSEKYENKFCESQVATYTSLENLDRCAMDLFGEYGIEPMTDATGQGYHYVARVDKGKPEHRLLEQIGAGGLRSDVEWHYTEGRNRHGRRWVDVIEEGAAFNGMGKLLEFVAHQIIQRAPHYGVNFPVNVGDIFPHNYDNEGVNLDLSCFEAPIHMRDLRAPFSSHQKQQVKKGGNPYTPIRIAIPRHVPDYNHLTGNGVHLSLDELFRLRENYWDAHNYAQTVNMEIPERAQGIARLAQDYMSSDLGEFHAGFDSASSHLDKNEYRTIHENFHHDGRDYLNPNTMWKLACTFYDGEPETARKLGTFLAERLEKCHPGWDHEKYPAESKGNFWMRVYCGMLHCEIK